MYGSIPIPRSAFPYLCTRHFVHSIFFSHRQGIFDRSFRNWDNHSQVLALANKPPITIVKISDAPKRVVDSRKFNHPFKECESLIQPASLLDLFVGELQKVCHRIHSYFLLLLRTECSPVHGADVLFDVHNLAKFTKSSLGCGYIPGKTPYTT